jgi:hypothetical protein
MQAQRDPVFAALERRVMPEFLERETQLATLEEPRARGGRRVFADGEPGVAHRVADGGARYQGGRPAQPAPPPSPP